MEEGKCRKGLRVYMKNGSRKYLQREQKINMDCYPVAGLPLRTAIRGYISRMKQDFGEVGRGGTRRFKLSLVAMVGLRDVISRQGCMESMYIHIYVLHIGSFCLLRHQVIDQAVTIVMLTSLLTCISLSIKEFLFWISNFLHVMQYTCSMNIQLYSIIAIPPE